MKPRDLRRIRSGRSPTKAGAVNDTKAASTAAPAVTTNTALKCPALSPRADSATSPITNSPIMGPTDNPPKTATDK
jgi:hypothetical protein